MKFEEVKRFYEKLLRREVEDRGLNIPDEKIETTARCMAGMIMEPTKDLVDAHADMLEEDVGWGQADELDLGGPWSKN
jgi:hypothetical protein